MVVEDLRFHIKCFKCKGCEQYLRGKEFVRKEDDFYCPNCYLVAFAPRCDCGCNAILSGKYITHGDKKLQ